MTQPSRARAVFPAIKAAFLAAMVIGILLAPTQALAGPAVGLNGSVSGSTLTVKLHALPHSTCSLKLGKRGQIKALPQTRTGAAGRGEVEWSIPSDTSTGDQRLRALCGHAGIRQRGHTQVNIPESAVSSTLTMIFNIALDVFLGASLVFFLFELVMMVVREPNPRERMMRSLALVGGAIVALGAQAADVGIASYTVEALTGTRPAGEAFTFLSVIIPGGIAAAFGWYFVRAMKRSAAMALRLVSFLGMLTAISFTVIFAEATNTQGVFLGAAAIPNASFVVGLIGSVVLLTPTDDERPGQGRFAGIGDALRRRTGLDKGSTDRDSGKRNPFADE